MLRLDHIAVAGETRQAATYFVQNCLQVSPFASGQHSHFSTHNHLWGIGEAFYLESFPIDPEAPSLPYPRWFGLDRFSGPPRIASWILATDNIQESLARLSPEFGTPVRLERGASQQVAIIATVKATIMALILFFSFYPPLLSVLSENLRNANRVSIATKY